MTIRVGTIREMTGQGYEILVDEETRAFVLARFFNGNFLSLNSGNSAASADQTLAPLEVSGAPALGFRVG